MNKKEVAEFLGVSERQVTTYAGQGRLSVSYQKGKAGKVAVFHREEVEKLKEELDAALKLRRPAIMREEAISEKAANVAMVAAGTDRQEQLSQFLSLIGNVTAQRPALSVGEKLLLDVGEAQQLTGLSRDILRVAIKTGQLAGKMIGRKMRIKRADLENYITGL